MLKKLILKKKTFQAFLMHHHRAELFVLFNWKKEEGVVSTMLRCSCALTQNLNYQKLLTNLASWEKNSSKQAVAITAAKKGSFLDHKRRERESQARGSYGSTSTGRIIEHANVSQYLLCLRQSLYAATIRIAANISC